MESALDVRHGIDVVGFENRLRCGTINFFDGWAANIDSENPIIHILFRVGSDKLGQLPIQKDRPDLEKSFHNKKLGFSGIINIPSEYLDKNLIVEAIAKDGRSVIIDTYFIKECLSDEEILFRKANKLPEDVLLNLVVQNIDPIKFLELGKSGVSVIVKILGDHQISMKELHNILDFGVGCGRVMRWWREWSDTVQFWGTDINPLLIDWCKKNIDFGNYFINSLHPPTKFRDSQFDLIYAFSVFTHLSFVTQTEWLEEFSRILSLNKYLLVSVHGDLLAKYLPQNAFQEYLKSGCYIMTQDVEGQNMCASYQNREFSEKLFSKNLIILDYLPGALTACGVQDLYLLQKK